MAKEFPLVEFRGLDLGACYSGPRWMRLMTLLNIPLALIFFPTVPIQTRYPPQNVRFEIADVTGVLRFVDASVDIVHARMTCLRVRPCQSTCHPLMTWAL